jgi:homoserine kinase type II
MTTVYLLQHVRADDEYGDHAKTLGIYRSDAAAKAAIDRLKDRPGFRDHPAGFHIDPYPLDRDHWTQGFGPAY